VPSVSTVRVRSISASLDAATVTDGSTAPEASLTVPAIDACADANSGTTQNACGHDQDAKPEIWHQAPPFM
jgi:hypothetical protein